jgi:hypothetical protein
MVLLYLFAFIFYFFIIIHQHGMIYIFLLFLNKLFFIKKNLCYSFEIILRNEMNEINKLLIYKFLFILFKSSRIKLIFSG